MKVDPLRELKEKMVEFVTGCIDQKIPKMFIVIDYDNCQYETERFVQPGPNKTLRKKCGNGKYKLIEEEKDVEPEGNKDYEGGGDKDVQGDVPGHDGEADRGEADQR